MTVFRDLIRLWRRLQILDPTQTPKGTGRALREYILGNDSVSLKHRFELPRSELRVIRDARLNPTGRVHALSQLLDRLGVPEYEQIQA